MIVTIEDSDFSVKVDPYRIKSAIFDDEQSVIVVTPALQVAVKKNPITCKLVDVFIQADSEEVAHTAIFYFTETDLNEQRKLIRFHGLNSKAVDVTVTTDTGVIIGLPVNKIDLDRVELNFSRVSAITNTWTVLIEK